MKPTMAVDPAALREGDRAEPRSFGPLTRTDFVRYQGASGDFNPIHHDEEFARAAGYPTVFSVGMLQAGILATFATDWLGADALRRFKVRFREQVWPGDVLTSSGKVVSEYTTDDGEQRVDVELTCARRHGGIAVTVWSTFVVPAQEEKTDV
jgi:acyl dehydratase